MKRLICIRCGEAIATGEGYVGNGALTAHRHAKCKMEIAIKGLRTMPGQEGAIFRLQLVIDGMKVAIVSNDGHGGMHVYEPVCPGHYRDHRWWKDLVAWLRFERPACIAELDAESPHFEHFAVDIYVAWLIDRETENKKLRRLCKRYVAFRLTGDEPGVWRTLCCEWTANARDHLRKTYGERIAEVANERFAGKVCP